MRDYESYNVFGEEVQADDLTEKEIDNQADIEDKDSTEGAMENEGLSVINVTDYQEEKLPVATYGVRLDKEAEDFNEGNVFEKDQSHVLEKAQTQKEEKSSRDTSFDTYVTESKKKEKSALEKWGVRLIKLIIFCMLLPFIGVIGSIGLGIAGFIALGILGCVGGGLIVLASTVFFASQISISFVLLGIAIAITAISFGMIATVIVIMMIKFIINIVRNKKKINEKAKKGVH